MSVVLAQLLENIDGIEDIIDLRDGNGWTPLHIVTANNSTEEAEGTRGSMIKMLVAKRADMEARRSKQQVTCLLGACGTTSQEAAQMLISLGADTKATNKDGHDIWTVAQNNRAFFQWLSDFAAKPANRTGRDGAIALGGGRY